mgnify:CR=1 FL=1
MHLEHNADEALHEVDIAALPLGGLATVLFLGVTAGVQMSDRGLHAILSPAIKLRFGVGDAVMGALHGIAGILIASALAVPLARLADRYSRKHILLALIAGWGLLTAVGALAPNFALFFLGRAASGVTEFAMIPVVYSLIPDLVGERWRVASNLMFAALMAIGSSAGFYLGGAFLDFAVRSGFPGAGFALEPWRAALLMLSLACLPLLLIGMATVDPARKNSSGAAVAQSPLRSFVQSRAREILLFLGAAGGLAIAVQATVPMIAMAIQRRFSADLGEIGHALGMITLFTSLGSLPLAGLFDRTLRERIGARARPIVMAITTALAMPCALAIGFAQTEYGTLAFVAAFVLMTCIANALIPTMLQDLVPADLRARGFAIYSFLIAAFCAVGPVLSGGISQYLLADNLLGAIAITAVPALGIALLSASLSGRR